MSINIKNVQYRIKECQAIPKEKIDSILNLLKEKNSYDEFCFYDYDNTNLVLLTQNLVLQKQVALQIIELKDPQFFVNKEINEYLISQALLSNFQIDEYDLNQYLSQRKVNLLHLNSLKMHNQTSLNFVRQIEDSSVYNKSIKDLVMLNDYQECKSLEFVYLNLNQTNLDNSTLNLLSQSISVWNKIQDLALHLSSNGLNTESVTSLSKSIENLSLLSSLTLNFSENKLGSQGLVQIAKGISKLQLKTFTLHLRENQIGSNGAKALGQHLENQQQLHTLFVNFGFNNIQSEGANCLIQGVSMCSQIQYVKINLQNNKIKQIKDLSNHIITQKGLKSLDIQLQNNKINSEEQSQFAQIVTELKNTSTQISLLQTTEISNLYDSEEEYQQSIKLQKVCPLMISSLGNKLASLTNVQSLSLEIKNSQIEGSQLNDLGLGLQHCQSLNELMVEIKDSQISPDQQLGLFSLINCLNISKIQIKVSDLKIEINSNDSKSYELAFKSVGFPLFQKLCDNLYIFNKFSSLKFDMKFCKIEEQGIICLGEQLTKLQNLRCFHVVAMLSDIGKEGVIQFFKKTKTIKGIRKMTFEYYGNSMSQIERKKLTSIGIKAPYLVDFCFTN
ncbi:hypothetical protein TTHERM_00209310 (macronuclear) [Tetrahymena thermophila SB210]|uniref:Kinase domain protein n=1 Tax=Tetrahymena thermophila (strain SB210) TaxID=312017 RepID=Q22NA8_TETTS|nr:hypothetical protein TTHERM_00209310 [Tetrahymena thermophila SB210]EAR86877.2 hypothetical protein TTHERM_00209310 [Tetrahymena thermophila SB210]|eukprot:XP_001007122.2 hypothetical protein TTHERM_00209310 [Tetrahymena thermophila SB210]